MTTIPSYYVNFSSQIIGFSQKDILLPFQELLDIIKNQYKIPVKEGTERVHITITFRCNDTIAMGVSLKPSYFNRGRSCDFDIVIIIPASDLIYWGFKLKNVNGKDNYPLNKSTKKFHIESVEYQQFNSMNGYLTFCGQRILEIFIQHDVIEKK